MKTVFFVLVFSVLCFFFRRKRHQSDKKLENEQSHLEVHKHYPVSRLLDKLPVNCPHADSCEEILQRGILDDHLRYRCSGTLVACQFAGAGCDYRGPSKSMSKHQNECKFKKEGKTKKKNTYFLGKKAGIKKSYKASCSLVIDGSSLINWGAFQPYVVRPHWILWFSQK